jgi:hypothetical protein
VFFTQASETINAAAGTFKIGVFYSFPDAVPGSPGTAVPFTLGGTAKAGTDYSNVSPSPLAFLLPFEIGYITGTLIPHPGGPNKTLTFTLGWTFKGKFPVNTLTITEPALATPARAAASVLAAASASAGGTVAVHAPVGNSTAPTTATHTVAAGPATPNGNVRATDDVFLAGLLPLHGHNVAPLDLTGNDALRLADAPHDPG